MITTNVQRHGTVLVSVTGALDESVGPALRLALEGVTMTERDLMVDLHGTPCMDADGLLHLLALHRHAESLGLRVLVVGWQTQPQQLMADVVRIRGRHPATGERYAVAGFRRLIEKRAQRTRDLSDLQADWLSGVYSGGPVIRMASTPRGRIGGAKGLGTAFTASAPADGAPKPLRDLDAAGVAGAPSPRHRPRSAIHGAVTAGTEASRENPPRAPQPRSAAACPTRP
ncbi:STAS domain-containing protein [Streptomyces sp. ISID311]|uniref:STAS domain-containing protein n=1 Tax=Streptomyces sp. ISID311 TaxID=2601673 RepID=UPI00164AE550|nr:STAS domain-containing protein [Streptomyces sp. ISID311]